MNISYKWMKKRSRSAAAEGERHLLGGGVHEDKAGKGARNTGIRTKWPAREYERYCVSDHRSVL